MSRKPRSALLPMYLISAGRDQPRKYFDEKKMKELCGSIEHYGLIHPVTVRSAGRGEFELIAGERRFRACELLGMEMIPAVIVDADDRSSALMAIAENMTRESLMFPERAACVNRLISTYKFTRDEVARELGISLAEVALYQKYAKLPTFAKRLIREYELSDKHVSAVLRLKDAKKQTEALQKICLNGLDAKQALQMVKAMDENRRTVKRITKLPADERFFKSTVRRALDIVRKGGMDADMSETKTENGTEIKISLRPSAV